MCQDSTWPDRHHRCAPRSLKEPHASDPAKEPTSESTFHPEFAPSSTVRLADQAAELRRASADVIDLAAARAAEATHPDICAEANAALLDADPRKMPARCQPELLAAGAAREGTRQILSFADRHGRVHG